MEVARFKAVDKLWKGVLDFAVFSNLTMLEVVRTIMFRNSKSSGG